jgi:hypothetical protein
MNKEMVAMKKEQQVTYLLAMILVKNPMNGDETA